MPETWSVLKLLRWATAYFTEKGIDSPRLDAELLLAHVLGMDRVGVYVNHDRPLSGAELDRLRPLVKRRGQREPLQYLTGTTEFWSLPFVVSPDVLIPRPDTEVLVEEALRRAGEHGRLLDIGTGSGVLAISLAHELPGWQVAALDISQAALDVARRNAETNGVAGRIDFLRGDLAELPGGGYDLLIANPPYVGESEWAQLMPEVRSHEPRQALLAGEAGLACYRQLAAQAGDTLQPGGWLLVEIGFRQAEAVRELFAAAGLQELFVRRDYAGQPRVVGGRRPGRNQ